MVCAARKLQALSPQTPTDGSGSRPVQLEWGEALDGGAWTDSDAQRSGGFNVFWFSSFYSLEFLLKTKHSTVNCQPLRSFSRVKPVGDRLHRQQTHAKVKRTGSFPDKVGDYAPVVSLQGVIPRRYALQFFLPSTVQIKARSIPPHGLERSAQLSLLC